MNFFKVKKICCCWISYLGFSSEHTVWSLRTASAFKETDWKGKPRWARLTGTFPVKWGASEKVEIFLPKMMAAEATMCSSSAPVASPFLSSSWGTLLTHSHCSLLLGSELSLCSGGRHSAQEGSAAWFPKGAKHWTADLTSASRSLAKFLGSFSCKGQFLC